MANIRKLWKEKNGVTLVVTLDESNYNGADMRELADHVSSWLSDVSSSNVTVNPSTIVSPTHGNKHELFIAFTVVGFAMFSYFENFSILCNRVYNIAEINFDAIVDTARIMYEQNHDKVEVVDRR